MASKEVVEHFDKARGLSEKRGDPAEITNSSWAVWGIQLLSADTIQCASGDSNFTPLLDQFQSPTDKIEGHYMLGISHANGGTPTQASEHLSAIRGIYERKHRDALLPSI